MKMKTVKTQDLIGDALDWAVAKCEGGTDFTYDGITWGFTLNGEPKVLAKGWAHSMMFCPRNDWAHGGPIIEREGISVMVCDIERHDNGNVTFNKGIWAANTPVGVLDCNESIQGPTPLIAAMRCRVASNLGKTIEVPEELL